MNQTYETVIGLEVHVEISTKTKIFCGCEAAFGKEPNTHTCPNCVGMPGALPVLNKEVVNKAIIVGLATGCNIARECKFDRKHYFYPDNPQNYQISQFYAPLCRDGAIEIEVNGVKKQIGIYEIHMEEDAGKLIHDDINHVSFVDYNRAGVPLIEIVSRPDMRSADEVIAYLKKLRLMIQYLSVSDCKLNEGSMRVDINLSVREAGAKEVGIRTEMKNLNSFRAIQKAIENESKRQITLIKEGKEVVQETRRWDAHKECSYAMRSKEDLQDYRYFPEPDLIPFRISEAWIADVRAQLPELRDAKRIRYQEEYQIPQYDIDIITETKRMADLFEETIYLGASPKKVSNWLMVETMRLLRENEMTPEDISFSAMHLASLIAMIDYGEINTTVAKEVFEEIFKHNIDPKVYVEEKALKIISDKEVLSAMIDKVLDENSQSVSDYKRGKEKAMRFIIGQTMKAMKGKANPEIINKIIKEKLKKD